MTKEEVQEVIELKQQEMPFDVKARAEALPISGKQIVTLPGVRRCGKREINGLVAALGAGSLHAAEAISLDDEMFENVQTVSA